MEPTPVSELEKPLLTTIRNAQKNIRRLVTILAILLVIIMPIAGFLLRQNLSEHGRVDQDVREILQTECDFYVPLVLAGNELTPKTGSKLGVQLVEGSRSAMHGIGCTNRIPPPTPARPEHKPIVPPARLRNVPVGGVCATAENRPGRANRAAKVRQMRPKNPVIKLPRR